MAKYQVRMWDSFYNNWCMIPKNFSNEEEAVKYAAEICPWWDCGEDGTQEAQIWIECLGGTAWQMIGYMEYQEVEETVWDWVLVECFG